MSSNNAPTFIDFEASSLDLLSSYPIEVGVCLPDGSTRSWLIKPYVLWKDWSEKAARIHGISREQLEEEGLEVSQVVSELNELLSGDVYCDAWAFDSFWLHRLFKAGKCKPNFHLDSLSSILDETQINQWQDIRAGVIEDLQMVRHRAANDAYILHKTWHKLGAELS
jgi:hypothetical protein